MFYRLLFLLLLSPAAALVGQCNVSFQAFDSGCGTLDSLTAVATGTAPFSYSWNTGETTATITPFAWLHEVNVTVTDADGCRATAEYFLGNQNALAAYIESVGDPCAGELPALFAYVIGGQPPYSYAWNTGETTERIEVVTETQYTVTVTDAQGCTFVAEGIYHPAQFGAHLSVSGPSSGNCDGSPFTLSVINPDPDFVYTWTNGTDTLYGPQITTAKIGDWSVVGADPATPACRSFGGVHLSGTELGELSVLSIDNACEAGHECLLLVNTVDSVTSAAPPNVTWTLDGTPLGIHDYFFCPPGPGVYEATVATPCDTATTSFTIVPLADRNCIEVCGMLMMDDDQNCAADTTPIDWTLTTVVLTDLVTGITYFVHANPDGSYCATLPRGKYQVTTINAPMTISADCQNDATPMDVNEDSPATMLLFARMGAPSNDAGTVSTVETAEPGRFVVFPNPSNGELSFDFGDLNVRPDDVISLYDGFGRTVERLRIDNLPRPWLVNERAAGIYRVVLTDAGGRLRARASVVLR